MIALSLLLAIAQPDTMLSRPAVEGWLDGFMARSLEPGDLAGAIVVVVRDTSILLAKGYGWSDVAARRPVDSSTTMFRPGSISKVFTWTAVMQLVEQGRLNLDADIQQYLDFPLRKGAEPITLRQIMTHTAGYEETLKDFYTLDPARAKKLGSYLTLRQPMRIYRAGSTAAYSNYATGLAGYIVERVSGQPFEDYVDEHVFRPLGMTRSSFKQPLPAALEADMSKGYERASEAPYPFELFGGTPAGGLSASGGDMARFMIAYLNGGSLGGQSILRPTTIDSMFTRATTRYPMLPSMGLGWWQMDRNGRRIIGHGGDTQPFHSGMRLLLDEKVGLYVSFNSRGRDGSVFDTRTALVDGFLDTFFPPTTPPNSIPTTATAQAHAKLAEGLYEGTRRWESSFLTLLNLDQAVLTARDDGTVTVSSITGLDGQPTIWREIGDWIWLDTEGHNRLVMTVEDGRVTRLAQSNEPATEFLRPPWWRNSSLIVPVVGLALVVLVGSILWWPIGAAIRRWYGLPVASRVPVVRSYRIARLSSVLVVALIVGWGLMIGQLITNQLDFFVPEVDWRVRLLSFLGLVATLAAVWLVWHAVRGWGRSESRLAVKLGNSTVAAAAMIVMLFAWAYHFVPLSVAY